MPIKVTTESFIAKSNLIHNNLYSYELVDYQGAHTKVSIICKQHGEFQQAPNNHFKGKGCKVCANESLSATAKSEFNNKANLIHDNKYDYSLVDYRNAHTKVSILCPSHGSFLQTPTSHLSGSGCPICALAESGWTRTKFKDRCIKNNNSKGILYVLECYNDTERFVKIGITSTSVKKRYCSEASMPYEYTVLHEIVGSPEFIFDLETLLHKKSKNYSYMPTIPFAGHATECFKANLTYLQKLNTYLDFNKEVGAE